MLFDDTVHGVVRRCIVRGNYASEGERIGALFAQGRVCDTLIELNAGPSKPGYFQLLPGSPCIDSGHPGRADSDGSRIEVGAFPFDLTIPPLPLVTCVAPPPSEGCVAELRLEGCSLAQGVRLSALGLPERRTASFVMGTGRVSLPAGSGSGCVAAPGAALRSNALPFALAP